jgi:amino acid permease
MSHKSDDNIVTTNDVDIEDTAVGPRDDHRIVDRREDQDLSRSLKQRHIQMIALAGAIVSTPTFSTPGIF